MRRDLTVSIELELEMLNRLSIFILPDVPADCASKQRASNDRDLRSARRSVLKTSFAVAVFCKKADNFFLLDIKTHVE